MRSSTTYVCDGCGGDSPRWFGRCPHCGAWNSARTPSEAPGAARLPSLLTVSGSTDAPRLRTGVREADRVLGGGLVRGSAVLLAGDPGIGKSTLVLQWMERMAGAGHRCLMATAEESLDQVALRARRLQLHGERLCALAADSVDDVIATALDQDPDVLFVDSIQTIEDPSLPQRAGSTTQVREVASRLVRFAKQTDCAVVLIGHVTKEGDVAGPKTLEHLVDAVLELQGDRSGSIRFFRALKNRFGSCEETGVFEMGAAGLQEVPDPSRLFLADRLQGAPGSIVFPSVEGTRSMLVEIQALSAKSSQALPRVAAVGHDSRRLAMMIAVVMKHGGLAFDRRDVFVAVAGGLTVTEPAADLAVCLALASTAVGTPVPPSTVAFGEVGLAGEVRRVPAIDRRLEEAARLGFTRAIVGRHVERAPAGLELVRVDDVKGAVEALRSTPSAVAARGRGAA